VDLGVLLVLAQVVDPEVPGANDERELQCTWDGTVLSVPATQMSGWIGWMTGARVRGGR
jgi:hypothetical protein